MYKEVVDACNYCKQREPLPLPATGTEEPVPVTEVPEILTEDPFLPTEDPNLLTESPVPLTEAVASVTEEPVHLEMKVEEVKEVEQVEQVKKVEEVKNPVTESPPAPAKEPVQKPTVGQSIQPDSEIINELNVEAFYHSQPIWVS